MSQLSTEPRERMAARSVARPMDEPDDDRGMQMLAVVFVIGGVCCVVLSAALMLLFAWLRQPGAGQ